MSGADAGCRQLCAQAGEPLAGSAGQAQTFVAISWPKRRWHVDKAARSEGLPAEVGELEARAKSESRPVSVRVFQRGPGASTDRVEVLVYRREGASFRVPELATERLPELLSQVIEGGEGDAPTEPLGSELLVCTDGQHDDCCARFGRPVYRALADALSERESTVRVSECSHLGGHRFAANLLHLPHGHLYGRVEPRDAVALVAAAEADRVLRYRYRGRLGASEASQAADAYLAARLDAGSRWEMAAAPVSGDDVLRVQARVHDAAGERDVWVTCERQTFSGPGSCGEEAENRYRWVPVELVERG